MYLTRINSYIEGIVRGYRNALLTSQNYSNLTQCENIDGMLGASRGSYSLTFRRCQATTVTRLWRFPFVSATESFDVCPGR
jgi:vacuolar-type H+-ATPase subunit C/Vma6